VELERGLKISPKGSKGRGALWWNEGLRRVIVAEKTSVYDGSEREH